MRFVIGGVVLISGGRANCHDRSLFSPHADTPPTRRWLKIRRLSPKQIVFGQLKGKTVAAEPEKSGVAIRRGVDAGKQLLRGMNATVRVALGIVAVLVGNRHTHTDCLAHVQWCAVSATAFCGRQL